MPIEHGKGGTTITGDSIDFLQLCAIRGAVGLEIKGLKRRGRSAYAIAKETYGLKGNRDAVYAWLCARVDELRPLQEHRTVEGGREIREVEGKDVN